jgi:hypothetical protein
MAEEWLKKNFEDYKNSNRCDAMNFGRILDA